MNRFYLCYLFLFFACMLQAQPNEHYIRDAERHIQEKKYASAHLLLEDAIHKRGFLPTFINPLVDNTLKHHHMHREYAVFYLKDHLSEEELALPEKLQNKEVIAFRQPNQLLNKVIANYPHYAWTYKLLGDYYRMTLNQKGRALIPADSTGQLVYEQVFANYRKSVELGYIDACVNRWLGDYFTNAGRQDLAKQYFRRNITHNLDDSPTYTRLAQIYLKEKKYNEAYKNALLSIQGDTLISPVERYNITRIAALSLYHLGVEDQFLDYIFECIQQFPDIQDAYLDVIRHYENTNMLVRSERMIRQMLLNNPFDLAGFKCLEKHSIKHGAYRFAENLLEEMIGKFEHYDEAMGNIYRFRGNLMHEQGFEEEARKLWDISKSYYNRFLPTDSPIIKQIGIMDLETSSVMK